VKVESAGTAHTAEGWRDLCNCGDNYSLFEAYVTLVGNDGHYYSCGMHNLGYRDAVVEADIDSKDAGKLLHAFLCYMRLENPTLNAGETFSVDRSSPLYRLAIAKCDMFSMDDLFHNPFGVWKLASA
jgi:hypothetical protein